ncbi:27791_t:CDS:2, partial [Dentiscutata erythropus]
MSGFWSIFGALVQCYSLQPPPYETFRSHYKVASPDDASAAIRGEFPEPVYKPKDDATSKSLVEKHLHVEEIKKTEKKTKLTK